MKINENLFYKYYIIKKYEQLNFKHFKFVLHLCHSMEIIFLKL